MQLRDDRRGQAIQIGAVLLLGALVLAFSIYQAAVVPDQNREIEFKHSQQVQSQLQDARNAIVSTIGGANSRSVSIELGTDYPSRLVALNPSPPSGVFSTVGTTNASINATVANAVATGETGDFWNGTNRTYNTGAVVYRPDYNEYRGAPTTWYEHSVVYNRFSDANLTLSGQRLIDGDRVSLVTLNGSFYESRSEGMTVDVRAVSGSSTTVPVTNATADTNVTVTVPTRLNESDWRELLSGEFTPSGHVVRLETTTVPGEEYQLLHVVLERGETYDLQLTRAGVGTGVERPGSAYLTDVAGNGTTVQEGGTAQVTVAVRDALNNPRRDRIVAGTQWDNSSISPTNVTADGQVTLTYEAPPEISGTAQQTDHVQVSLNTALSSSVNGSSFNGSTAVNVSLAVNVANSDGSGLGGDDAYDVFWRDPAQTGVTCDPANDPDGVCTVNASATSSVTLTSDTGPSADGATIDYSVNNSTVGTVSPSSNVTNSSGEATTTFSPQANGSVFVYASGGGSGDRLELVVENVTTGGPGQPNFVLTIDSTNSPVFEGDDLLVNATVENTGGSEGTQDVTLDIDGTQEDVVQDVTLSPGGTTGVNLSWSTTTGDAGNYIANVSSNDDFDNTSVQITNMAGQTTKVTGSGTSATKGVVSFDLRNTGTRDTVITGLKINSTDVQNADYVDNDANREFDGAGGYIDETAQIDIGPGTSETQLDSDAVIGVGATETFTLGEFRKANNDKPVEMNKRVVITVFFEDGSQDTYTISP